ncbi:MAG TPA: NAD(P)/FAD-dependent oxidoreductase [Bacteriovoracaceae bacterium]|nr:NAD(P)/FAD-dependent oxidoreductase [Bacteriovoracaceae bacterium]
MNYDAIVIGAGMSGLAAGIRLAMFDKKVVILEKHTIAGGLNSYYQRRNFDRPGIRQFDVGLHALTNYIKKGEKGKPFSKLLKQLRLSYDEFHLSPQSSSKILFPDIELNFSNDFELLTTEVMEKFPLEQQGFRALVDKVKNFNELDLAIGYSSSRAYLETIIKDELLIEMLICPLLVYGSAWEEDMDFAQFVIMFKSIYFEGFSRPEGGVRTIISLLLKKYQEVGGELRLKTAVSEILTHGEQLLGVVAEGEELKAPVVFSSIGLPETYKILPGLSVFIGPAVGKMTFLESIFVYQKKIPVSQCDSTIIFYNDSKKYHYRQAKDYYDPHSAVVCFPDNYRPELSDGEGVARVTYMANYQQWKDLPGPQYQQMKEKVADTAAGLVKKLVPQFDGQLLFKDVFTPTTIERYTWHLGGTVYGSTDKSRDGRTPVKGLYIIGTDQGFLGIVGAILSGISMANLHGLMGSET